MSPRKHFVGSVRFLLVCAGAVFVFMTQPSVAVAQTRGRCLATADSARAAITALRGFTFTDADVLDRGDVQEAIDTAIQSLADNVLSQPDTPSRLADLCEHLERLAANTAEQVITGDDCAGIHRLTCEGETLFENYQDAVEALGEDAIPKIRSADTIGGVRLIIRQVYTAVRELAELVIEAAEASVSPSSDSPAIADALDNQANGDNQAASCLAGAELVACGNAVGSYFDAWLNGIIEIIE